MKITRETQLCEIMKLAKTFEKRFTLEFDLIGDCRLLVEGVERYTAHNNTYLCYEDMSGLREEADGFPIVELSAEREVLNDLYEKLENSVECFNERLKKYRSTQNMVSQKPVADALPSVGLELSNKVKKI